VKPDRLCRTLLLAVGPYVAVVACSGSRPVPSEPPPKTRPAEPTSEKTPDARLVFSNCHLGNAIFEGTRCQEGPSGGRRCPPPSEPSCTINASCIKQQGVITPRDGSVYMDCKEGRCSCHLRAHAPPETVVEFEFAASCSSLEVMRQLMRDHCLAGMEVIPRSGVPDAAPGEN
jgi:hypothetical protein